MRRDAHRRLATAVTDPEQRARHLALAAEGPDRASPVTWTRPPEMRRRGAPAAAAELARFAAELTPPDAVDERADRLITAAEHHRLAGEHAATRAILELLVEARLPVPGARALFLPRLDGSGQPWPRALCAGARRGRRSTCADRGDPAPAGIRRASPADSTAPASRRPPPCKTQRRPRISWTYAHATSPSSGRLSRRTPAVGRRAGRSARARGGD